MMDECEASLQVLRGVDADITVEANDIKARTCFHSSRMDGYSLFENSLHSVSLLLFPSTFGAWLHVLHSCGIGGGINFLILCR
jgi:hypothetical protein